MTLESIVLNGEAFQVGMSKRERFIEGADNRVEFTVPVVNAAPVLGRGG